MKAGTFLTIMMLISSLCVWAADPMLASSIKWQGATGSLEGDTWKAKHVFMLQRPGVPKPTDRDEALMEIAHGEPIQKAIAAWIRDHPKAVVVPIVDYKASKASDRTATFVWVVDGVHILNIELVRQGFLTPFSQSQYFTEQQKLEVSRADYDAFVQQAAKAGQEAQEAKAGVWRIPGNFKKKR